MQFSATLFGIFGAVLFNAPYKSDNERFVIILILFFCLIVESFVDDKYSDIDRPLSLLKALFCYICFTALSFAFLENISSDRFEIFNIFIFGAFPAMWIYLSTKYGKNRKSRKNKLDDRP